MQAPNPFALASHLTRLCLVISKCLVSIIWCIFDLMLLNAELCSAFQSNLLFLASGFSLIVVVVVLKVLRGSV